MSEHYNTDEGYPQSKEEVNALSDDDLFEFYAECDVEPADFDHCLACYAYKVACDRENDEEAESVSDIHPDFIEVVRTFDEVHVVKVNEQIHVSLVRYDRGARVFRRGSGRHRDFDTAFKIAYANNFGLI